MSTAAEYRARAAEAEMIARQMSRRDHKEEALQLARDWSRRAEVLETQERGVSGGATNKAARTFAEDGRDRRPPTAIKSGI